MEGRIPSGAIITTRRPFGSPIRSARASFFSLAQLAVPHRPSLARIRRFRSMAMHYVQATSAALSANLSGVSTTG